MLTIALLISIVVISVMAFPEYEQNLRQIPFLAKHNSKEFRYRTLFVPYEVRKSGEYYRFLSSGFIHANWLHLIFNAWALYLFGRTIEAQFALDYGMLSSILFLILYFGGMIVADLPVYLKNKDNPTYASLGASGAVSAVVFAYILYYPMAGLMIFPIPIEIPAVILGLGFLAYSYYSSSVNAQDNIGHDAHFYGALFGFTFTLALKPTLIFSFVNQIRIALGI